MRLQKEQQKDNKQKFNKNLRENAVEDKKRAKLSNTFAFSEMKSLNRFSYSSQRSA